MSKLFILVIRGYQKFFSPVLVALMGPSCRFYPSCSQYAVESIGKHGSVKGVWLAGYRIMRCQPFSKGGYDPVP
ncbi:MAG: membrane protein insertion efficiency factor YidD [Candidatus Hydrogenedentota bacterium]|nr:MAG: membrane protein insertion efficiency factor YidD [Candidatus Hydrogenedentota bacterium]